ncbi:MAG: FG-GAP-like repeat-containing protein [Myxococcota bacterium]
MLGCNPAAGPTVRRIGGGGLDVDGGVFPRDAGQLDAAGSCDDDSDGERGMGCGGSDCADEDPRVNSNAVEVCDGVDNDCDGVVDQGPLGLCRYLMLTGEGDDAELGFRFGSPLDVDGDGVADIATGGRFADFTVLDTGYVGVWSTSDGRRLQRWEGQDPGGLLGHSVFVADDLDGDGHRDVVASAPQGAVDGGTRGAVYAWSGMGGALIWSRLGGLNEVFGWHVEPIADLNGDGVDDVVCSSIGANRIDLLDGRDGHTFGSLNNPGDALLFGWHHRSVADVDGDGLPDIVAGAPGTELPELGSVGAAFVLSSATGETVLKLVGEYGAENYGLMVEGLPDLDGDSRPEIAVGRHQLSNPEGPRTGQVDIHSIATGALIHRWSGHEDREMFGRFISAIPDVDGDGTGDVAVSAPWASLGALPHVGRLEVRSGRSGAVLAELRGSTAEEWLGWTVVPGHDLTAPGIHGLVVSALRAEQGGHPGAGYVAVFLWGR